MMNEEIIPLIQRMPRPGDRSRTAGAHNPEGVTALQALAQAMLRCYARQDFRGFDTGLRRLMRLAAAMGLPGLGRVAADVCHCLHRSDATALAATWARLQRLLAQHCGSEV